MTGGQPAVVSSVALVGSIVRGLLQSIAGLAVGALVLAAVSLVKRIRGRRAGRKHETDSAE